MRILVLDDEPSICRLVRECFAGPGLEVLCAQEVEEALAVLEHRRFDALVVDLHLSAPYRAEGLDLVAEARYRSPGVRIVVHTGDGDERILEECLRAGADAVVAKGEPLARLRAAVLAPAGAEERRVAS